MSPPRYRKRKSSGGNRRYQQRYRLIRLPAAHVLKKISRPATIHLPKKIPQLSIVHAPENFPGNITQRQQPSSFFWQAPSAHQSGSVFTQNHKNYCIIWLFSSASQETSVPIRPSWNNPLLKMGLPSFSTTSSGMTILCWCLTQLSWVTMPIRRSTKIILIFIHRFA